MWQRGTSFRSLYVGTATLSLKLASVVPGRWICSFSYCGQAFFLLLLHRWAVVVRTSIFRKISYDVTFFLWLYSSKTHRQCFFVHIYLFSRHVSSRLRRRRLESISLPPCNTFVYTSTRWISGDFTKVYYRNFCRENCLTWLYECWSSQSGGVKGYNCLAAAHRISPILARLGPN